MLRVSKDLLNGDGEVLFKADTEYDSKGEEVVDGKKYFIYESEIEGLELLLPESKSDI